MSKELFRENQDDIKKLLSEIDKVIYESSFLDEQVNYKLNVMSLQMKALIIQHEIDMIEPRGDFYQRYQVEWPCPFFKTHYGITQQINTVREKFRALASETLIAMELAANERLRIGAMAAQLELEKEIAEQAQQEVKVLLQEGINEPFRITRATEMQSSLNSNAEKNKPKK